MKLNIAYIKEAGDIDNERVVLKVVEDCDIGNYFSFFSHYTDSGNVSTSVIAPFWFMDTPVKRGDTVVIYTKSGTRSSKQNKDGTNSYFFYRNNPTALCGNEKICAVLLEVASWRSSGERSS